jgi:hypothetical protein
MGRGVGTMVETELTIVAFVHHPVMVCRSQFGDVALIFIDPLQEGIERRTEIEATAATIAHIINSQGFLFEGGRIDWLKQA